MKTVGSYVFVDEVKDNAETAAQAGHWHYLMGIGVSCENKTSVELEVIEATKSLGTKGFHARKQYKAKSPNVELMRSLTAIILRNQLPWFCFPFGKEWLNHPRLAELKKYKPIGWQLNPLNHEQVAFLFMIHLVNWHLPNDTKLAPSCRMYFDDGLMDQNTGLDFRESTILQNIECIEFTTQKRQPLIILADHIGFLFGRCRREIQYDGNRVVINANRSHSVLLNECSNQMIQMLQRKLFIYMDLGKWIDSGIKTTT
jgi:hypothetical protein